MKCKIIEPLFDLEGEQRNYHFTLRKLVQEHRVELDSAGMFKRLLLLWRLKRKARRARYYRLYKNKDF